jgi:hypothetical protein
MLISHRETIKNVGEFLCFRFSSLSYAEEKRPHEGRRRAGKMTQEEKKCPQKSASNCMGDYR